MDLLDPFHWCALAAGSISRAQGRGGDSHYERVLAYAMYEAVIKVTSAEKQDDVNSNDNPD
jgi:hypothetical protein